MHQTELLYHEAAILTRLTGPDEPAFSAAAADDHAIADSLTPGADRRGSLPAPCVVP